jgi:hypothetical protein
VLKGTFECKGKEVAGSWRKLQNEKVRNLYALQNIIRINKSRRMGGAVHIAHVEEMRNSYNILGGKPEGRRPLGRHRHR